MPILFRIRDIDIVLFLTFLPALAGVLLHIGDCIALVDNLHPEDRLDYVFQGDEALETAVFVDNKRNLIFGFEKRLPYVSNGSVFIEHGDISLDLSEGDVEFVFSELFENCIAKNVAGDEFRRVAVDGDSGVMGQGFILVELPQGH